MVDNLCPDCGWTSVLVTKVDTLEGGRLQWRCGTFIAHTQGGFSCRVFTGEISEGGHEGLD